ncbi:hypothetical protein PROPEN_03037 [Proteus penneri ATCC 35198]|nr:hypothetical protein PROPEN_03037 [Proteus penneri ATCC 35198]
MESPRLGAMSIFVCLPLYYRFLSGIFLGCWWHHFLALWFGMLII